MFGPKNGAVSEKLVHDADFEAHSKGYAHLMLSASRSSRTRAS